MNNPKGEGWTYERLETEWLGQKRPIATRCGFAFKGARTKIITNYDWAKCHLREYEIDGKISFYVLEFERINGEQTLVFVEYSENDLL